ncbi:cob(I)yrinic acid a,c-diamide adenosyltransferase [Nanoarchaeota archaeon]
MSTGLIQVYTGNGKGKTTASLGIALRAIGQGLSVYMIQFLKSGETGELFSVKKYLPRLKIVQFGKDALEEKQVTIYEYDGDAEIKPRGPKGQFYIFLPDREEKEPSRRALEHAWHVAKTEAYDILILDEINCALDKGLITIEEVMKLIDEKPEHVEVIMTGRNCPEEIIKIADLVSEINEIKHPFSKGVLARRGIDF